VTEKQNIPESNSRVSGEISIVDIIRIIIKRKRIIAGAFVIQMLIVGIYLVFAERVYQVTTYLIPPQIENIQGLNLAGIIDKEFSAENLKPHDVFMAFLNKFESHSLQRGFFDENKLAELYSGRSLKELTYKEINDYYDSFVDSIKITRGKNKDFVSIALTGIYRDKIAVWLDSMVEKANKETVEQLVKNLRTSVDVNLQKIKDAIKSKRFVYKQRRLDEIERLREQYQIAKKLGIDKTPLVDAELFNSKQNILVNTAKLKDYMKGTTVLLQEIKSLESRKSDDAYVPGLRDLQEKQKTLENFSVPYEALKSVIVDKKASTEIEIVRPNKKMVLLLSFIFSVFVALASAFLFESIVTIRSEL